MAGIQKLSAVLNPFASEPAVVLWPLGRLVRMVLLGLFSGLAALALPPLPSSAAAGLNGDWVDGHAHRVRLIAGRASDGSVVAGVEIEMDPGWKTYWRSPGESGGVPPYFDWSASRNVASTSVAYPAPRRLKDAMGDSIGYKDWVVLPVRIVPADPNQPLRLELDFSFGVCRDICIPAEAKLNVDVPAGVSVGMPKSVRDALDLVPRTEQAVREGDPRIVASRIDLTAAKPKIDLEIQFGDSAGQGDAFAEAPAGVYLPMLKRVGDGGQPGAGLFRIDLQAGADFDELRGQSIRVTMVGGKGQSEETLVIEPVKR